MKIRLPVLFALGFAGSIALVVPAACSREEAPAAQPENQGVIVGPENVMVVTTQELQSGPVIAGSIQPVREAAVRAEVSGSVLQTYAEKGQVVRQGAILARLDDIAIRDTYLSAKSAVRTAQQARDVARRNAERTEKLAEAGAIAARDLETARWNVTNAESQLADARARLSLAEEQLANTQVRAPISGIVSERPVNAGDVVQPGAALYTIVDPSRMRLEALVPSQELGAIRVGAPVQFRVSGYSETFQGTVERINPAADPATHQVPVYISIPNTAGRLVAGLFAEGRVASDTRMALAVPLVAIDNSGSQPTVTRVKGGTVERVTVQLGIRDDQGERIEIVSGLSEGDTVLIGTARGLTPGVAIRVQRTTVPAAAER